jgi:hypothetical protein
MKNGVGGYLAPISAINQGLGFNVAAWLESLGNKEGT